MVDITQVSDETTSQEVSSSKEVNTSIEVDTSTDPVIELEKVRAELKDKTELLAKVRKFEKEFKAQAERESKAKEAALKEQGEYKALYESLLSEVRVDKVQRSLDSALQEAQVDEKFLNTAKALINNQNLKFDGVNLDTTSLAEQIQELKKNHSQLFKAPQVPEVKRANDGVPTAGYEKDLRAAKTSQELNAVLKKYGKL